MKDCVYLKVQNFTNDVNVTILRLLYTSLADEEGWLVGWLVVLRNYAALVVLQPYRYLEAGDNQSLKIQVARPGIRELNHSATAAPDQ